MLVESYPYRPELKSHKVNSKEFGEVWSSRVTGDLRILWKIEDEKIILLLTIGGHQAVIRFINNMKERQVTEIEFRDELTLDHIENLLKGDKDFIIKVAPRWYIHARTICNDIVVRLVRDEYAGDLKSYIRDVESKKRLGITIVSEPSMNLSSITIIKRG